MRSRAGVAWLALLSGPLVVGCAAVDAPTADPEAQRLSPPVVIIDEPEPEPVAQTEDATEESLEAVAKDPNTEVITFVGADAPPGMADEITAAPKRDPSPSMLSGMRMAPNK